MTTPRIHINDLKSIVSDADERAKGAKIVDAGGVAHLAELNGKLFCDAVGSGGSPYKVQIHFGDDGKAKGRCSCMAARSRPFCKHACALLIAWASNPDAFARASEIPDAPGEPKKKRVMKSGDVDAPAQQRAGVAQVLELVQDLAIVGQASARLRADDIAKLGASLRENQLRRLSARTLELTQEALQVGQEEAFAEAVIDLLFSSKKIEKSWTGEPLEPKHVETLIGKTWTKKDRTPIADLRLLEYNYASVLTADNFVIRQSYFVDVGTGQHYAEKQILPKAIAKRTPEKMSYAGKTVTDAAATAYPGFAPVRVDLETPVAVPTTQADLQELLTKLPTSVSQLRGQLSEWNKDIFAPDVMPAGLACSYVLQHGQRLVVRDAAAEIIFLPESERLEWELGEILLSELSGDPPVHLKAILGELYLDDSLPTLSPRALLVEHAGLLRIEAVQAENVDLKKNKRSRRAKLSKRAEKANAAANAKRLSWAEVAADVGVGRSSIMLAEVRAELARALALGLSGFGPRAAEPLAARLADLSLTKPAALLLEVAQRTEATGKLEDFCKVHQVCTIALNRLAGAIAVETPTVALPLAPSIHIPTQAEAGTVSSVEAIRRGFVGEVPRFVAEYLADAWYVAWTREDFLRRTWAWSDGYARRHIVDRCTAGGYTKSEARGADRGCAVERTTVDLCERDRHYVYTDADWLKVRAEPASGQWRKPDYRALRRTSTSHWDFLACGDHRAIWMPDRLQRATRADAYLHLSSGLASVATALAVTKTLRVDPSLGVFFFCDHSALELKAAPFELRLTPAWPLEQLLQVADRISQDDLDRWTRYIRAIEPTQPHAEAFADYVRGRFGDALPQSLDKALARLVKKTASAK